MPESVQFIIQMQLNGFAGRKCEIEKFVQQRNPNKGSIKSYNAIEMMR